MPNAPYSLEPRLRRLPASRLLLLAALLPALYARGAPQPAPAADAELALFAYDRSAPLALHTEPLGTEDGVAAQALRFASPRGGQATGRLFVGPAEGRKAGVVLLHGAPGSAAQISPWARRIARHGAVVLALDAPFARRNADAVTFTPADRDDLVQLIVDLQRAVDVLLARPDVDPARIAFVGGSYGGSVGALYAGVDPRPRTFVLCVAGGGFVSYFTGAEGAPEGRLAALPSAQRERWLAAMRPVEALRWVSRARPGTILFQSGRADPVVPPAKAGALHRAAGPSHAVRWFASGHALPPQAREELLQWLHARIGTAAPAPPRP